MVGKALDFDDDGYTPEKIEESLKNYFRKRFKLEPVYINAAYKIDDFYEFTQKHIDLNK